jgi:hypothetical protein
MSFYALETESSKPNLAGVALTHVSSALLSTGSEEDFGIP